MKKKIYTVAFVMQLRSTTRSRRAAPPNRIPNITAELGAAAKSRARRSARYSCANNVRTGASVGAVLIRRSRTMLLCTLQLATLPMLVTPTPVIGIL